MSFLRAVKTCFVKFASIDGRASRSEFWWFHLFYMLATFGLLVVTFLIWPDMSERALTKAPVLMSYVLLVPSFTVAVRRLHDGGRSGFWMLLLLIPLFGAMVLFAWWTMRGTPGDNEYGPDPLAT